jgi:hypothetical protein
MEFKYSAYIPSTDSFVQVEQLKTKDYIELVKYITNDEPTALIRAYDELLADLCPDIDVSTLTRVDKFFILITVRAICVGPILNVSFEDAKSNKPYTTHVELFPIMQRIADIEFKFKKRIKINNNVSVDIKIPRSLYIASGEDLLIECIDRIIINKKTHDLKNFTVSEKSQVVDSLPGVLMTDLYEYINEGMEVFADVDLFNKLNPHNPADNEKYSVNIFDTSMYSFINLCYNDSLSYIRDILYVLQRKCHFSGDILYNSTFAEIRMYIDLYEDELKRQEKADREAQQNQNQQSPRIGGASSPMTF